MANKPISELTPEERAKRREYQRTYMAKRRLDPVFKAKANARTKEYYRNRRKNDPEFRIKNNSDNLQRYHTQYKPSPEFMERRRESIRTYQQNRRKRFQDTRKQLQQTLGGKCVSCGINDWRLLDFDHKEPKDKLFNISQYLHLSIDVLLPEVQKCELRCPNCHRLKTMEQGEHNSYKLRKYRNEFHSGFKSLISAGKQRGD